MMRRKLLWMVMVLAAAAVPAARAQDGVYVMYTGAGISGVSAPNLYGPVVGAYLESTHVQVISAGVDFRAGFLSGSNNSSVDSGMAGFRLVVRPRVLPIAPYGEMLVGFAQSTVNAKTTTDFQTAGVLGLDYTLVPHVDWRVVELSYARVNAANAFNPTSVGTGIVLRF